MKKLFLASSFKDVSDIFANSETDLMGKRSAVIISSSSRLRSISILSSVYYPDKRTTVST